MVMRVARRGFALWVLSCEHHKLVQIVGKHAVPDPDSGPVDAFETGSRQTKPSLESADPTFDTGAEPVPVLPPGGVFTRSGLSFSRNDSIGNAAAIERLIAGRIPKSSVGVNRLHAHTYALGASYQAHDAVSIGRVTDVGCVGDDEALGRFSHRNLVAELGGSPQLATPNGASISVGQ